MCTAGLTINRSHHDAANAMTPGCDAVRQSENHLAACVSLEFRGWDVCRDCGAAMGEGNISTHFAEAKHRERVKMATYCGVCNARPTTRQQMVEHLRGRRHLVTTRALQPFACLVHILELSQQWPVGQALNIVLAYLAGLLAL